MPLTNATGVNVCHAIARALATANLSPSQATYRVETARVWLASHGEVSRGAVTLLIRKPRPLTRWEPHELEGWVNPDGDHPGMVLVRLDDPIFVDSLPVTWGRWDGPAGEMPRRSSPDHPRLQVPHAEAMAWVDKQGRRIPTRAEFKGLWGTARFPWGDRAEPGQGRVGPIRYKKPHEVGLYPSHRGLFDLGAWLWHWLDDGTVAGGVAETEPVFGIPPSSILTPIGFRTVADP